MLFGHIYLVVQLKHSYEVYLGTKIENNCVLYLLKQKKKNSRDEIDQPLSSSK